jgi:hypothetical protein
MNKSQLQSFHELFTVLSDMHFFYDQKIKYLIPYLEAVEQTWNKLLACPKNIAHHTFISTNSSISAICTSWRSSGDCWCIQNGIASNIRDYIKTLVLESSFLLQDSSMSFVQTWFNPNNRIVNKMCGLGTILHDGFGVYEESTFCMQWEPLIELHSNTYMTDSLDTAHSDAFRDFIMDNRSRLFYDSEYFASDPYLKSTDSLFSKSGLQRTRFIDIVYTVVGIQAVVISYLSSPGINFSFLENRTEIIVQDGVDLSPHLISEIGGVLRKRMLSSAILRPVVTDRRTGTALIQHYGATLLHEYTRRIWTKEAFQELYDYITNKYCQT